MHLHFFLKAFPGGQTMQKQANSVEEVASRVSRFWDEVVTGPYSQKVIAETVSRVSDKERIDRRETSGTHREYYRRELKEGQYQKEFLARLGQSFRVSECP
jgi:hypothetical protein